jgi:hypothetical protein
MPVCFDAISGNVLEQRSAVIRDRSRQTPSARRSAASRPAAARAPRAVLDEATAALDSRSQDRLMGVLPENYIRA